MRDTFDGMIMEKVACAEINGDINNRVCNTTNIRFKGVDGRKLLARLDSVGVRCSQSSACTNFSPDPSFVLTAMGLSTKDAYSSIRFSFSTENNLDEVDMVVKHISKFCKELKH